MSRIPAQCDCRAAALGVHHSPLGAIERPAVVLLDVAHVDAPQGECQWSGTPVGSKQMSISYGIWMYENSLGLPVKVWPACHSRMGPLPVAMGQAGETAWRWDQSRRPAPTGASPKSLDWGPPSGVKRVRSPPHKGVLSPGRVTPMSSVVGSRHEIPGPGPRRRGLLHGGDESCGALPLPRARASSCQWSTAAREAGGRRPGKWELIVPEYPSTPGPAVIRSVSMARDSCQLI